MKPCVSIIVPVYKAEKYLDRCVESLIGQTLQNIEVILVDDGSPDSSAAICDRWAEREPRIKVVHKPNGGPGSARNAGIEVATGEYITFVDSDDYVLVDTYSTLYSEAVTDGYDAVYNGYTYYYPDGSKEEKAITDRRYDDVKSYIGDMLADDDIVISVCMGIYRASIIRECALKFIPECEYEDLVFNFDFLIGASKVRCLPRAFYQYCYNGGSLSQSFSNSKVASGIRLHENLKERLRSNGIEDLSGKEGVFFIGMTVGLMKSLMLSDLSLGEKRASYAGFYEYKGWKELQKAVGGSVPATKRLLVFLIRHKLFYLSYLFFKLYYGIVKK